MSSNGDADRGSGLGLFVVQRIIDGAGGKIELSTAPGEGATFHLQLPDSLAQLGSEELDPLDVSSIWQGQSR